MKVVNRTYSPINTFLLFLSIFFLSSSLTISSSSKVFANDSIPATLKIGVLAKRGPEQALKRWEATAEYLSEKIPDNRFEIIPLDFEGVSLATMSQSIDFLITNSSSYVSLKLDYGMDGIATLRSLLGDSHPSLFGGVIIVRADRTDINSLNDLVGKSFYAVDQDSLGGWLAAWHEFNALAINPDQDFSLLKFTGTHDAVVMAVLSGEADAGTVRTDTLEHMVAEEKIVLADVKILNKKKPENGFDYLLSTQLYPEWPFVALPHVSPLLAKKVTKALVNMPVSSSAAKAAKIAGWEGPQDYQSIHDLLKERHLNLYQKYIGEITLKDFFRKYWQAAVLLIVLCIMLAFIAMYKAFLNKQLEQRVDEKTSDLRKEMLERKQMEEERERLLQAIDQSSETIVITDLEGTIQYVNPAFEKISGYTCMESIGQNPRFLKSGEHDEFFYEELWATLAHGEMWQGHFFNKKKDGTLYIEDARISPVFNTSGEKVNYIAVKRDITREIEMDNQLRQKHKMEAIGTMASGIAHNFNNNLAIILGNVELAQLKKMQNNELAPFLNNAKIAALRARDLIQNILTYSREGANDTKLIQLPRVVNETINLLRSTIPTTVAIEKIISPESRDTSVNADSSQIQEVLFNLCNNAVQAMDEKGVLKLLMDTVDLQAQDIPAQYDCLPGRYARLSVQDTGSGISAETIDKIFDPFFTTKDVGKGTGMGLSTVQGIIKHHNGLIKVKSSPDEGTTFDLYFPVIDQNKKTQKKPEEMSLPEGSERILCVDDDDLLASLYKEILTDVGYQVTIMTNSMKALKLFTSNADQFDLVLTDQTMPELCGKELIQEIKKIRSDIPTILCTGHSNKINGKSATEIGIHAFLMKPVKFSELLQTVRRVLDEIEVE